MHAIIEIMGHRLRAGIISDATLGGATLLRIEHPTRTDHTGEEPLTEYYAPSAIFAIRPCSPDECERVAAGTWPASAAAAATPALTPAFGDLLDDVFGDALDGDGD